ncbi:hypothetical protein [Nocardiopsis nanhaiensis]
MAFCGRQKRRPSPDETRPTLLGAVSVGNAHPVDDRTWISGISVIGAGRIIADVRGFPG